jgi:hypothetical protein
MDNAQRRAIDVFLSKFRKTGENCIDQRRLITENATPSEQRNDSIKQGII